MRFYDPDDARELLCFEAFEGADLMPWVDEQFASWAGFAKHKGSTFEAARDEIRRRLNGADVPTGDRLTKALGCLGAWWSWS